MILTETAAAGGFNGQSMIVLVLYIVLFGGLMCFMKWSVKLYEYYIEIRTCKLMIWQHQ